MHSAAWVQRAGTQLTRRLAGVDREKLEAFALMALCARARVGAGVAPLAGAYFAANLRREKVFPALLMGCAAGAFCTGVEPAALFAPASCALVLIFHLAWDALARHFPAMEGDAATRVSLMAGISVLLPALAAAGYAPGRWLGALLAGVAAAFGALNLGFAPPKTQRATEYAAFSCAGVAAAAALGLPAEIPAVFCAVSAGTAKRGALAGVLLGALTALTGGGAEDFVLLSAMGAASDAAAPGKRRAGCWGRGWPLGSGADCGCGWGRRFPPGLRRRPRRRPSGRKTPGKPCSGPSSGSPGSNGGSGRRPPAGAGRSSRPSARPSIPFPGPAAARTRPLGNSS